jgi:hypothetical protein
MSKWKHEPLKVNFSPFLGGVRPIHWMKIFHWNLILDFVLDNYKPILSFGMLDSLLTELFFRTYVAWWPYTIYIKSSIRPPSDIYLINIFFMCGLFWISPALCTNAHENLNAADRDQNFVCLFFFFYIYIYLAFQLLFHLKGCKISFEQGGRNLYHATPAATREHPPPPPSHPKDRPIQSPLTTHKMWRAYSYLNSHGSLNLVLLRLKYFWKNYPTGKELCIASNTLGMLACSNSESIFTSSPRNPRVFNGMKNLLISTMPFSLLSVIGFFRWIHFFSKFLKRG